MTEDDVYVALVAQLDPGATGTLPAPYAAVPYTEQNVNFQPPADGSGNPLPWAYLSVEFTPSARWSAPDSGLISVGAPGNNLRRKWGILAVEIFVPVNDGDQLCRQIAAAVGLVFEGQDFGSVTCTTYDISEGGKDDDGNWWSRTVITPFYFDQYS